MNIEEYEKKHHQVLTLPGRSIKYFIVGSGPAIFIFNPVGQRKELWRPLVDRLVKHYKIIWVTDIAFGESCSYSELQYCSEGPEYFLEAVISVLDKECIDNFISLSWCAASKLALELSNRLEDRVSNDVYLAPSFAGMEMYGALDSDFEKDLYKMMSMVNLNTSIAPLVTDLFHKTMEKKLSEANDVSTKTVTKLAYSPFLTEDSVICLSERIVKFFSHDVSRLVEHVTTRKHLFIAENDNSTSSVRAKRYFQKSKNCSIVEISGADHYLPFNNAKYISEYIQKLT